jgi:hypothetical protein
MANGEDQKQIQFFFTPIVVPQGDGSFVVKPGKPTVGRKKLLIAAAADRAGVSEDTIRRLLDAGCWRESSLARAKLLFTRTHWRNIWRRRGIENFGRERTGSCI